MTQKLMPFSVTTGSRMIFSCKMSMFKCQCLVKLLVKCCIHPFLWWENMPQKKQKQTTSVNIFFFFFLINNFLVQEKNKSQKRTGRTTLHLLYKRTFLKEKDYIPCSPLCQIITSVFKTSILPHFMLSFQISLIKEVGVCFRQVKNMLHLYSI